MFWLMGMFWLLAFAVIGGMVGWELKGLMVEHQQEKEELVRDGVSDDRSRSP